MNKFYTLIICTLLFSGCGKPNYTAEICLSTDGHTPLQMAATVAAIEKRLSKFGRTDKIDLKTDGTARFSFRSSLDMRDAELLITTPGEMRLSEVYHLRALPFVMQAWGEFFEGEGTHPNQEYEEFFSLLYPLWAQYSDTGPSLGQLEGRNREALEEMFGKPFWKELFPYDARPVIMEHLKEDDIHELIILRGSSGEVWNGYIQSASYGVGQYGHPQVYMEFDKTGARKFAEMTKNNIDNIIAALIDGKVVCTPRVNSEITSGQFVITGQQTPEEFKIFAALLDAAVLEVPVKIISIRHIN